MRYGKACSLNAKPCVKSFIATMLKYCVGRKFYMFLCKGMACPAAGF